MEKENKTNPLTVVLGDSRKCLAVRVHDSFVTTFALASCLQPDDLEELLSYWGSSGVPREPHEQAFVNAFVAFLKAENAID